MSGFFLWGEGDFVLSPEVRQHPRGVSFDTLEAALRAEGVPLGPPTGGSRVRRRRLRLVVPAWPMRPVPSSPAIRDGGDYSAEGKPELLPFEVDSLFIAAHHTTDVLLNLPELLRVQSKDLLPGDDVDYWSEVARWTFDLLLRRRIAPTVDDVPRWRPVVSDPHERERFERFANAMPAASRTASLADALPESGDAVRFPTASFLLRAFLDEVIDSSARDFIRMVVPAERRRPGHGEESQLVASLAAPRDAVAAEPPSTDLLTRFRDWSLPLLEPLPEGALRLAMRLHSPEVTADPIPVWTLRYHLESTEDPTLELPAAEIWGAADSTLRRFGRRFTNPQETLLARLGQVAPLSAPIKRSLDERHPSSVELSLEEAHRFLVDEAPLLAEAGV
ncbi:MAG: hypothetical protein ABIT01_07650, partial [Thermoanaerobaculia bacterium]